MSTQVTWDTFTPRPRIEQPKRFIHLEDVGPWEYCTTRQDAEVIVRDIGRMPQGGTTHDRLMDMGRPDPHDACHMNPQDRILHYWSHNTRGYSKHIEYDGTVTDWITVRRGAKGYDCDSYLITGARIEDDELILETDKAEYGLKMREAVNGSMCNYCGQEYDPEAHTEHLMIYALSHGKTPQDIRRFMGVSMPVSLAMFTPWVRGKGGELVPSKSFDAMMDLAHELGLRPKVSQDVRPYRPWIMPIKVRKYCQRRILGTCEEGKKNDYCVGCSRFYANPDIAIDPKDRWDAKSAKKVPARYCEEDDDE